jgi:hypothetical protein
MRQPLALVELERALEIDLGLLEAPRRPRGSPGPLAQRRLGEGFVREGGGPLEVVLRLLVRRQRGGTFAGAGEHLLRLDPDRRCVFGIGCRLIGVEVVGGDHLDDLLLAVAEGLHEMRSRGEMADFALGLGERLVGDPLEQVLEEAVLTSLGGARIGLHAEHLFPHE